MAEMTAQQKVVNYFFWSKGWDYKDPKYRPIYGRWAKVAIDLLKMADGDPLAVKAKIDEVRAWADHAGLTWNLSTVVKRWLEDNTIEKKMFTKEGDPIIESFGRLKVRIWTGELRDYNGSKSDIVYK